jgi:hypothetical protein
MVYSARIYRQSRPAGYTRRYIRTGRRYTIYPRAAAAAGETPYKIIVEYSRVTKSRVRDGRYYRIVAAYCPRCLEGHRYRFVL